MSLETCLAYARGSLKVGFVLSKRLALHAAVDCNSREGVASVSILRVLSFVFSKRWLCARFVSCDFCKGVVSVLRLREFSFVFSKRWPSALEVIS